MCNGRLIALSVLAVTVLQAGCATQPEGAGQASSRPTVERVGLSATRLNAGEIGQAYLIQRDPNTDVIVQVSGVPDWVTAPVHLYAYIHQGSCANLGPVQYPLTSRVLATGEYDSYLTLRNSVPVSFGAMHSGAHALVVKSAPADWNTTLFCGDLKAG